MNSRFIVPGVSARTPLAEAAPVLLMSKADPLFALEDAARSGADADAIHDMRVASRRMREAMRLLAPLYPPKAFRTWYRRVRRITRALGPVRDSDVFIEDFAKLGGQVGEQGKRAVAFMVGYRMGLREHELDALNAELARLDLERNRRSFDAFAWRLAAPAAAGSLAAFAYGAIAERAGAVFGAQPRALVEENITRQHELRIDYKRLRYAVEVFAPCYEDDLDSLHVTLTAFQDTLGDMHDTHVFLEMLRAPERIEAARRAGVPAKGLAEVERVLEDRAAARYRRFVALADENPADVLLARLLLPLARVREPEPDVEPEEGPSAEDAGAVEPRGAAGDVELAVISPVVVGDEPWAEGWDQGETVVEAVPIVSSDGAPSA